MLVFLQENEEHGVYLADMGTIDDCERSNLIIDKDTQQVYDTRKEIDLAKLERQTTLNSGDTSGLLGSADPASPR